MKKLLFLFDTDPYASVFDTVVAYDGGADRVAGYANVTPDNVGALGRRHDLHPRRQGQAEHGDLRRRRRHDQRRGAVRGGEEEILRTLPRLRHARLERLEHDRRGGRGAARQGQEAQGQEGCGAGRHRAGRHAGGGLPRPGGRRCHHHLAGPSPGRQRRQGDRGAFRGEGRSRSRRPTTRPAARR